MERPTTLLVTVERRLENCGWDMMDIATLTMAHFRGDLNFNELFVEGEPDEKLSRRMKCYLEISKGVITGRLLLLKIFRKTYPACLVVS